MEEQGVRILWPSQSKREMRLMMMMNVESMKAMLKKYWCFSQSILLISETIIYVIVIYQNILIFRFPRIEKCYWN